MFIWLSSPDTYIWIFRLVILTGLGCGVTTYFLTARKGRRRDAARPLIGLLFGSLMFLSFCFLGNQLIQGRFYALTLSQQHMTLHLINGETVHFPKSSLIACQIKETKRGQAYLEFQTHDGAFYRAGPLKQESLIKIEAEQSRLKSP